MSLTAPRIKGVVTKSMDATPSATVMLQAVSTPGLAVGAGGMAPSEVF